MEHTSIPARPPAELPTEALAALQTGNKIEAIKVVRAARGLDLKGAKDLVDRYVAGQPGLQRQMATAGAAQTRKLVFVVAVAIAIGAAVFLFRHAS